MAIYGPAGSGKTRLACCAMRADPERWGQNPAYIAVDPGSHAMSSVLDADMRFFPLESRIKLGSAPGAPYDPYDELIKVATSPEFAMHDTFILDTATVAARDMLQAVANSGKFSDKHVTISTTAGGKLNMAMQGDYGATQQSMFNIFRAFEGSGKNFICIFHDGLFEPEANSSAPTVGGPATAGKGAISGVAGWFHNLVRCESRTVGAGPTRKNEYWVHTEKKGPFLAKLRIRLPENPMTEFKLNPDPVNFWQKLKEIQ